MFADLMVHLDGGPEDEIRIAHAESLAAGFKESRITGLFTNPLPEYAYVLSAQSGYGGMEAIVELESEIRERGDHLMQKLSERLARPGSTQEVRRLEAWPSAMPGLAASQARCADLFIATTPYRDAGESAWEESIESVLFESGHGLYLIPPHCPARENRRTILLAWNDSRPAARALSEALPFLRQATKVQLLTIDTADSGDRGENAIDIAAHLDRHGVKVEITALPGKNEDTGAIIREEAKKISADMIVMGAYAHSRFKEWILGGATRDVIENSDIPVFLAH